MNVGRDLAIELTHCGAAMRWLGTDAQWIGKPGQGSEINSLRLQCGACGAIVKITLEEPV